MDSVRTCLVCRTKAQREELCRFVRSLDGEICFDEKSSLPHRGAWICPSRACMTKAFQKKMLFRGEKTLPVHGDTMVEFVVNRIKKGTLTRLGFLRRLGHAEAGRDAVKRLLHEGKAEIVLIAKDFSKRSYDEICEKTLSAPADCVRVSPFSMDEIGQSIGRKKTGVVGILKSRITDELSLQLKKLSKLEQ